jgi:hypothetical protein
MTIKIQIIKPRKPWDQAKRERVKRSIDRAAARMCRELGAYSCLMIVTFEDGDDLHILDGGTAPMPSIADFYDRAKAMHVKSDETDTGFKAAAASGKLQ